VPSTTLRGWPAFHTPTQASVNHPESTAYTNLNAADPVPIAIIGGTGLSSLPSPPFTPLAVLPPIQTPWGTPSSPITILSYTPPPVPSTSEASSSTSPNPSSSSNDNDSKPTTIAFLARHGTHHEYAPHEVNNRANVAALRKLGVRCAVGFSAVGSLREEVKPRDFVVGEQVVDWTRGVSSPESFLLKGKVNDGETILLGGDVRLRG